MPSDVSGVEEVAARSVVAALGCKNFQSVYLADLNAAETWLSRELAGAQAGDQDARLKALAGRALGTVRADLKAVQGLISGAGDGTGGRAVPASSPRSATLDGTDLQIAETSYSGNVMEYFLAKLTDLQTDDSNVDNYAEKLIEDHEQELVQLGSFAAATGTYLPASIPGTTSRPAGRCSRPRTRRRMSRPT